MVPEGKPVFDTFSAVMLALIMLAWPSVNCTIAGEWEAASPAELFDTFVFSSPSESRLVTA